MVFSSPFLLWALSLVLIPIAIHLFQFRRYKKLYFSDISLLKEVKSKSQTKNQLKHLLILFSRIGIIALLVLAFSDPIIPSSNGNAKEAEVVSIYIDNSFSMEAETERGQLLQEASRIAFEIASSFPQDIKLQLISNEFTAAEKRFFDLADFSTQLDNVLPSPLHKSINQVFNFIRQSKSEELSLNHQVYLLSDFKNTLDSSFTTIDSNYSITLVPLNAAIEENISIDSTWIVSPIIQTGREMSLFFRIHNHGSQKVYDIPIEVDINDQVSSSVFVSIEAESYLDTFIILTPENTDHLIGQVRLDDYPIAYDNDYYFTINVSDKINVAEIKGNLLSNLSPFEKFFKNDRFNFLSLNESEIVQDSLKALNLLIINQVDNWNSGIEALCLEKLKNGNNIIIVLPSDAETKNYYSMMKKAFGFDIQSWDKTMLTVNSINEDHYAFKGVFESHPENINYPNTSGYYSLNKQSFDHLIAELFNQKPLIASNNIEKGEVFIITTPLNDKHTNLHRHALFVPFLMNVSVASGLSQSLSRSIETNKIKVPIDDEKIKMSAIGDSTSFVPALTYDGILINGQIKEAGNYEIVNDNGVVEAILSFNYSRNESSVATVKSEEIENYFESRGISTGKLDLNNSKLSESIAQLDLAAELWPIFAAAALILLLFETLLLKVFS